MILTALCLLSDEIQDLTDQLAESSRRVVEMEKINKRLEIEKEEFQVKLEDSELTIQQEVQKLQRTQSEISGIKSEHERRLVEKEEELEGIRYVLFLHSPGDAVACVTDSSLVALHALLSCVMCVASCNVIFSSLQSSLIMSILRFFGLPLFVAP